MKPAPAERDRPTKPAPAERQDTSPSKPEKTERSGGTSDAPDRPGNNGTVKIDTDPYDTHPNNEPHVACAFEVDFSNYGAGDYWATVDLDLHSPTSSGRTMTATTGDERVYIGEDPPGGDDRRGGGTDIDAEERYQLELTGAPHPKQGYHVKLTIDAPDSHGARVKHKVFWVEPCQTSPPGGDVPGGDVPGGDVPGGDVPGGDVPGGGDDVPGADVPVGEGGGDVLTPPGSSPTRGAEQRTPTAEEVGVFASSRTAAAAAVRPGASAAAGAQPEAAAPAEVPTAVEAGLAGDGSVDLGLALSTSLLGLCGLLAAAVAVTAYRSRGEH